jgi:hypothetical protein
MNRISLLLLCLVLAASTGLAQLAVENFDYAAGQLTDVNGGANVSGSKWVTVNGTTNVLTVVDGSLSYAGYPSSGIGRMVQIANTGEDASFAFSSISAGTVYASFLLNVDNVTGLSTNGSATGDYFALFSTSALTTTYVSRPCIRKGTDAAKFQLGLRASSSNATVVWDATEYDPGQTLYIVIGYTINAGTGDDVSSLWVNPAFSPTEPAANATQVCALDLADAGKFGLRQGSTTPNAKIDGIRISDLWSDVALPVQLSSFSALRASNDVQLSWKTISEVNNFGFYVERKLDGTSSFVEVPNSFVAGHATTLEAQSYSFTDNTVTPGVWYYRLRQVDLDGSFGYSEPVKVEFATSVGQETPATYGLSQNYPNPFNPSTDIQFSLARAGTVTLTVYDMLGREVATLVNGERAAGVHHVMFNAINLPSGAYFYALKAGSFMSMKSMMLVK